MKDWTYYDHVTKQIFYSTTDKYLSNGNICNDFINELFINQYVSRGIYSVTLSEFKKLAKEKVTYADYRKWIDFDGRKRDSIYYGTYKITSGLFERIKKSGDRESIQQVIQRYLSEYFALKSGYYEKKLPNRKKDIVINLIEGFKKLVQDSDF